MRLLRALGLIAFLAAGATAGVIASAAQAGSLIGKVLVANEGMPDPRFQETVIYLVDHGENGALGLVVNKPSAIGPIAALLDQLGIETDEYDVQGSVTLHYGGPVEPERGFVLHSADYEVDGTEQISSDIALTLNPEALVDIALGQGPRRSLIIFGYSGWGPSQLEGELARGDWTVTDADADLVLGTDHESKWRRSLKGIII